MPDDVFYVLKAVLMRLISTGSTATLHKMVSMISELLERELAGVLKFKMDAVYATTSSGSSNRAEKDARNNFIVSKQFFSSLVAKGHKL